jgi:hypothetical protein
MFDAKICTCKGFLIWNENKNKNKNKEADIPT